MNRFSASTFWPDDDNAQSRYAQHRHVIASVGDDHDPRRPKPLQQAELILARLDDLDING